jgi:hypothetical protein
MTLDLARGRQQLLAVTIGGPAVLLASLACSFALHGELPNFGPLALSEAGVFGALGVLLARGHAWLRWPIRVWLGLMAFYYANVLHAAGLSAIDVESAPCLAALVASPILATLTWSRHVRGFIAMRRVARRGRRLPSAS